jgi:hypothetical protein
VSSAPEDAGVLLVRTGRVAAEVTAERLIERGIEARVHALPNVWVRLASGGNYRVEVHVPSADLDAARAEMERWQIEAAPRVNALAREVGRVLAVAALVALGASAGLLAAGVPFAVPWGAGAGLAVLVAWTLRSRRRAGAPPP